MRLARLAALALAAGVPLCALAQSFSVSPAHPTPLDTITISKPNNNEDTRLTHVIMSGNRVTVQLQLASVGFPEPPPGNVVQAVGKLPAGSYQLEVVYVRADGQVASSLGTTSITVAPRAAGQPIDDYSDMWWNPAESGWGLDIAQHSDGQLFATWFVYAADGSPLWYVVPGGRWSHAVEFDGDIYRTTGPALGATFDPNAVTRTKAGSASFLFGVNGQLTAIFTIDGVTIRKILQRQSF